MTVQPVTLNLPGHLYDRLKRQADEAHRTVEAELLDVVMSGIPLADELPADLSEALSPLALLDDDALWRAARSHLPEEAATEMENLHLKRQRDGLSQTDEQTLAGLVRQYERAMLVRGQAAVILKQRGLEVSGLLTKK